MIPDFGTSSTGRKILTRSGQTFSKTRLPNGQKTRAVKFFEYVALCESNGHVATRKGFLCYMEKPTRPGYWSDFFAGIIRTGAVKKNLTDRGLAFYTLSK